MPGYWNTDLVQDYEAAHYLIDEIRRSRQVEYRIAYLLSSKQGAGYGDWYVGTATRGMLPARTGSALLYRSDKLRNTQRDAGLAFDAENNPDSGLMNSIPCCNVRSGTEAICGLIDGPMIHAQVGTARSGPIRSCDTPAGAAFTRRQSIPHGKLAAVLSRLELKKQPGNFIHIYNVHFDFEDVDPDATLARLVTDMEERFAPAGRLLYPPIVAGDFNLDRAGIEVRFSPERSSFYPRFSILRWSPEVMGSLIGTDEAFPAKQKVIVRSQRDLPDFGCKLNPAPPHQMVPSDPLTLWSDHCGSIYLRILPVLDRPN